MIKPIKRTKKAINQAKVSMYQGPTTSFTQVVARANIETNGGKATIPI